VPGDILILQEGEKVAADARIIFANNLRVDESLLTGESLPVAKTVDVIVGDRLSVAEQKNLVFRGTNIVSGNGMAIVVATGLNTVIGKIAQEIISFDTDIPLKKNIRYLSRLILAIVVCISIMLLLLGVIVGQSWKDMFVVVVSLAVSIIPEGLPVVITLVLVTGVWRMAKNNALVKKLQAVEALGQIQVLAVDKTGTVTKNEMMVEKIFVNNQFFEVSGSGYDPTGDVILNNKVVYPLNHNELLLAGRISALCSNARVFFSEGQGWHIIGDPTEAALSVFAQKLGFNKDNLEKECPKIAEVPFDNQLKYHAVVCEISGRKFLAVVGAPEVILKLSARFWYNGRSYFLTLKKRKELEEVFMEMSREGLRVLGIAFYKINSNRININFIKDLIFVGFIGIQDTLREEVHDAILKVREAGLRIVMITGDYLLTAKAIAQQAGIYQDGDRILTGQDLEGLPEKYLLEVLNKVSVFARVTSEHKLKIINAYRKKGIVVAMTGDGVNDAPSLVAADVGVAMGKIGTEVAKEAADIVLLDDNFGNIVVAVEEGRSIYKTIKKVVLYLFSTSLGEVFTIAGALLLGYPVPISPAQIIWLNLVTDGFLTVALAMEPKEQNLLKAQTFLPKKYIVDLAMVKRMFLMALPMAIGTIILFSKYLYINPLKASAITLTTLAVFQWFNAWNCRHDSKSIFSMAFWSNKFLIGSMFIVMFLQLLAIYNPLFQSVLRTTSLNFFDWCIIIVVAATILVVEELRKLFYRKWFVLEKLTIN
jgi:Ca2+-transporting ATPase